MNPRIALTIAMVALLGLSSRAAAPEATDERGFRVHEIRSQFQAGTTRVRVLAPEQIVPGRRYRSIYVLPVEAGHGTQWGDGLLEIKQHDLHNQHRAIFVAPEFSRLPWYADHPTDPAIRQESYLLQDVFPLIEASYPIEAGRSGACCWGSARVAGARGACC